MHPKFDETKPYGEIHNVGKTSAMMFEQDGCLFDGITRKFVQQVEAPKAKPQSQFRFDPDKPHGFIMDASDRSVRYSQNGKLFAPDGSFVRDE